MKLNKEKFLKTELGTNLIECVTAWDKALNILSHHFGCSTFTDEYRRAKEVSIRCQAQWEVYQILLKQFFNVHYHFSRTDNLCCIVDAEFNDFLYKVEKGGDR